MHMPHLGASSNQDLKCGAKYHEDGLELLPWFAVLLSMIDRLSNVGIRSILRRKISKVR